MSRVKRLWFFAAQLKRLTNQEFENLIIEIIESKGNFQNIQRTKAEKDPSYDIFADFSRKDQKRKAIFQIKRTSLVTPDYIRNIGDYWTEKDFFKYSSLYIVTDGALTTDASTLANKYDITIWDLYSLNSLISEKQRKKYFYSTSNVDETESQSENMSTALMNLDKGPDEWSTFQQLSCDIFSYLFSPPLESPRYEHSDEEDRNRRDMIYENTNEHPFWKMIRDLYQGYYIVVDAKNSGKELDKKDVISIAHYLKPYGCGMFGILLCRIGMSQAGQHAIREQWIGNNKMIVALNDYNLMDMLKIKEANEKPEEVIRMKLADFRMKL